MESLIAISASWAGVALLAVSGILLAVRSPSLSTFSVAGGFVVMAVCQVLMNVAPKRVEYVNDATGAIQGAIVRTGAMTEVAQIFYAVGLLVGAGGLLAYARRSRSNRAS
jgi:hypothetical protein